MNFLLRSLTHPSVFNYRPRFFFSIPKEQIIEMHQALLASKIIHMIKSEDVTNINNQVIDSSQSQTIVFPSLRSQLISKIKQYSSENEENGTNEKVDDDQLLQIAKKNMLKFFDGGVWVDSKLCRQQRFFSESDYINQIKSNKNQISQINSQESSPQSLKQTITEKKKLTFCPTYLITGQIFRNIVSTQRFLLITDHFGIGKTYSFMLYHLLSDIIYRYLHKYCKKGNYISDQIPKLVYWSIDIDRFQGSGQKLINQIIAKQCYELTQAHPNYNFFVASESQVNLKQFYLQKNIYIRLVIDQIDIIPSARKNAINLIQLRQSLEKKSQYLQAKKQANSDKNSKHLLDQLKNVQNNLIILSNSEKNILKKYLLAQKLLSIVQTLRANFGRALYLSPRTFQKSQMCYLDLNGQHTHQKIQIENQNFMEFSKTEQNLSDLAQFFVLMLELRYKKLSKTDNLSERQKDMLTKIKKIIFDRLKDRTLKFFPYTIKLIIFESSMNQIIKQILDQKRSQQHLERSVIQQLISKINNRMKCQLSQLIDSFLKKSQSKESEQVQKKKKIVLLKLLYAVKQKINSQISNPELEKSNLVINASDIFNPNTIVFHSQLTQVLKKKEDYLQVGKKFYLTVNQYILVQILQQRQDNLLQALLESNEKIYRLFSTKVARGLFIKSLLIKCLSKQNTKFVLKTFEGFEQIYNRFLQMENVNQKLFFSSIPLINSKNYNNYSFLTSILQKIKLKSGSYLFVPDNQFKTANIQENKIDEKSKKIDFVLTQKHNQLFRVVAFDVTIDKSQFQNKIVQFLYEFSNFQDKQQQQFYTQKKNYVELNYIILVHELPQDPIQWKNLFDQAILLLENDIDSQKNKKSSSEKIYSLQNRISFLKNLSKKENLLQSQSSLQIDRSPKCKSLLTKISIYSFFDAQITNPDPNKISLYTRLLNQAEM